MTRTSKVHQYLCPACGNEYEAYRRMKKCLPCKKGVHPIQRTEEMVKVPPKSEFKRGESIEHRGKEYLVVRVKRDTLILQGQWCEFETKKRNIDITV